jgi:hypothetical protein
VFFAEQGRLEEAIAVLTEGLKHVETKDELERMRAMMVKEVSSL